LPSSSSLRSRRGRLEEEEEENDDDDDDDADDEFAFRRRRYLFLRISSSFEREKLLLKHIYERIVAKRVSSTNAKTHICEHINNTTTITPRDRKEEKERKRKKPILSPVHLSSLEQPSHQTRADTNEIP